MNTLQLISVYILYNACVINRLTKNEFKTDLIILEFNNKIIAYDLKNNNLELSSNFSFKKIENETREYSVLV